MSNETINISKDFSNGIVSNDLSILNLFLAADPVVKIVMVLLIGASIWCWAIIFEKIFKIRKQRQKSNEFEENFWSGGSLDELYNNSGKYPKSIKEQVFVSGMKEWRRSSFSGGVDTYKSDVKKSIIHRIERNMNLTINREMEKIEKGIGFLASIGSVSPFVGLFGTVWGIMNSFQSIADSKNTSLAVVAPGIAEALFATALGLAAAIPAVTAYNKFSNDLDKLVNSLEDFAQEFSILIGRKLDED